MQYGPKLLRLFSFSEQDFCEAIDEMPGLLPVTGVSVDQPPECRTVIVVPWVREFVDQHVVDALASCLNQMRVSDDLTRWGAASPLA
jgi:hypothetical protein